ncbi:universal stress protein [Hydrogenophaga electricum]|uniref:Universal stress protein UspA n=1 Tax=Hydrogenophaga electricum TaxID=1230953 RepID=A0ABQ6C872_9BURK|nr:universal stress protein [Hydrogenophaga electricum]GLS16009.1 universal stress protein UspA [Hydrogenophaga electricum]
MIRILIPTDGSTQALQAAHHVLRLCGWGLKARFVVANVQPPANLYEVVVAHDPVVLQQVSEAAGRDLMRPVVQLLQAAGMAVESVVVSGDPAQALVELVEAHDCHLIVLGAQGHGALRAAVLGSVSQALLQTSPVPVTVVGARPEDTAD